MADYVHGGALRMHRLVRGSYDLMTIKYLTQKLHRSTQVIKESCNNADIKEKLRSPLSSYVFYPLTTITMSWR